MAVVFFDDMGYGTAAWTCNNIVRPQHLYSASAFSTIPSVYSTLSTVSVANLSTGVKLWLYTAQAPRAWNGQIQTSVWFK